MLYSDEHTKLKRRAAVCLVINRGYERLWEFSSSMCSLSTKTSIKMITLQKQQQWFLYLVTGVINKIIYRLNGKTPKELHDNSELHYIIISCKMKYMYSIIA